MRHISLADLDSSESADERDDCASQTRSLSARFSVLLSRSSSTLETSEPESPKKNSGRRIIQSSSQTINDAAIDVIPLQHIPYVHGGYAAAAPIFVREKAWMDILAVLMPDSYSEAVALVEDNAPPGKLMKWAEHNPVVTAFGILQGEPKTQNHLGSSNSTRIRTKEPNLTPIEWDVFLDPNIVIAVDQAMTRAQECKEFEECIASEIEVDRQVGRLVSRLLLAHGSTGHLVSEAIGLAPKYNFNRVAQTTNPTYAKSTSQTTGIFVGRWLHIFLSSLQLAERFALRRRGSAMSRKVAMSRDIRRNAGTVDIERPFLCGLLLCMGMTDHNSLNADHAINDVALVLQRIKDFLGSPLSVVLDLKSRRVPPRVWGRLIDNLRSLGLCVQSIGSFDIKELRAISKCSCTPITPIIFFHSAGDLQRACHSNEIENGDHVYFNAGSLLWQRPDVFNPSKLGCCASPGAIGQVSSTAGEELPHYVVHPFAHPCEDVYLLPGDLISSTIEQYQQHYQLYIGVYIQEFSICQEALEVLIHFFNFNQSIYKLGMAYGGLNGATIAGLEGDGYWNQRFVGKNWNVNTAPTDTLIFSPEDNKIIREIIVEMGGIGTLQENDEVTKAIQEHACVVSVAANHGDPYEASRLN